MSEYKAIETTDLVKIANAIRLKKGSTDKISLEDMPTMIREIEGGVELPELSNEGTAADLLSGKELINSDGNKVTGTIPNNGAISSTMDGLNAKQVTIPAGYTSGGTVSLDNTIDNEVNVQADLLAQAVAALEGKAGGGSEPSLQSKSVTPSAVQQTVVPDSGYDGLDKVTVNAIPSTYVKPTATKAATTYTPTTSNQTIAAGTYCSGAQTIKGDSNLVAGNIKFGVSIFGVAGTLTAGIGGGTENYEDELLDGTIVNYTNSTVSKLRNAAFMYATALKTVNLPACSHIGQSAFIGCTALTTASFETCISIASSAFQGCTKLNTLSFPACKSIYWAGFSTCTNLTEVNLPNCTYVGGRAFQGCTKLKDINLPECRYIYSSTFQSCKSLATISLPEISIIGSTAFGSCTALSSLYMTGSRLCTLSGSNAFTGTKITSTSGAIYVPASMLASYQAATNWTYFSNRMVGV